MKSPLSFLLALCLANTTLAQLITGVTDRTIYTDSATFSVPVTATLNGEVVTPGSHTVNVMDYYELFARRNEFPSGTVTTQLVRFIVVSSRRGSPETGLIEWTPYPPIPSASEEFAGAELTVIAPQAFPTNFHIPVIAWIDSGPGNARRVNGNIDSSAFPPLPLRRGVGHTFLPPQTATFDYDAKIQSLNNSKHIAINSSTSWQNISGNIPAGAAWPENSRIHITNNITILAGNNLTVGAGSVIWIDPSVNITNTGRTVINGTKENPVVFTSATPVSPEQHTGAWGGFLLRGPSAELVANGAIFTGSGAVANFNFSPGVSHRSEQALLLVHSGAKAFLTNCFLLNNAGQVANGYSCEIVYDHCLLQRAVTAGEFVDATLTINNSAVIEFPVINGVVDAAIADADYDGMYFTSGSYLVKDSLLGFCKDDAIDAGGDGGGPVTITNCWFESALHEGIAWSGGDRPGSVYDSVFINCGQGIECGYSAGPNSPFTFNERVLSLGNAIGARYGDNYTGTTGTGLKEGFLTLTNSILIHNYRDVFGHVWDNTWNYRDAQMDVRSNYLSAPNPHHPSNTIWDSTLHAPLLAPYMRIPTNAAVGIGFANWTPLNFANISNGIPIRLSSFTTHPVEFKYAIETPQTTVVASSMQFPPGQTVLNIPWSSGFPTNETIRIFLHDPTGAEITTAAQQLILPDAPPETEILLHLTTFGADHVLHWTDPTTHLQSTANLADPQSWTDVLAESPYTIPEDGGIRFYRLQRDTN